jgi:outer membrane protein OmpA-like peptidoglycan-associated protein/tetratricopeptide (TPR) repeat protein
MNNLLIKASFIGILVLGISSCTNFHIRKGDNYFENLAYHDAINQYEKVYPQKNIDEVELKLAEAYFKTGKIDSSEQIYKRAVERANCAPVTYFNYARVLMANGQHNDAAVYLKKYLQMNSSDLVAEMLLSSCNSISQRYRDTTLFELKPVLEDEFTNSFSLLEYQNGAIFTADKEVYSGRKTAAWTGNSYLELYTMQKDEDGNWLSPELLKGDVNGRFHEGPATFSPDGNTIYFTRSNYFKRKMVVNESAENNLKIFQAKLVDGKWKNLVEFPYNSDDYSVGHPALSSDGKTMYFVSDMPGGFGGSDIYKTKWENNAWSKPENLGIEVNTNGNEMFPYIHSDGALYFSSDAHNTMGGLDVFITYFNGTKWAKPENLNYPLNSIKDDFGFSLNKDETKGFVSSSRTNADKMYSFDKKPPTFNLLGIAREKGTNIPVAGVIVEVTNTLTGQVTSMTSDAKGNFKLKLAPEANYDLYCTKFGCFSKTDKISTIGMKYSEDFFADFEVEPIVIDKPIVLENIYYDFDKWDIRADAAIELDKLVRILNDNPTIEIEMGSHTDTRGIDQYNLVLSDKRAMAAVKYLISQGIDASRLTFKGYGEKVLVNGCKNDVTCSEEDHQKNRRTEFKVTKIRK